MDATKPADDELNASADMLLQCVKLRCEGRALEALRVMDGDSPKLMRFPPLRMERAFLLADLGRFEESLSDCNTLISISDSKEVRLVREQIRDRALAFLDEEISIQPSDTETIFRRANIYLCSSDYFLAVETYRELLLLDPKHWGGLTNLAVALVAMERYDESLECYTRALDATGDTANTWYNMGNVLRYLHRLDAAVDAYQRALRFRSDFPEAQLEICFCQLMSGAFESGWARYEWRWKTAQLKAHYLKQPTHQWLGSTDLSDKTILLWAEQGFGDTIQFSRYAVLVADMAGKVILRAPVCLKKLLQTLDSRIVIIDDQEPIPDHDMHCPLMSLPLASGINSPTVPVGGYLSSLPEKAAFWSSCLGTKHRPRIGISWAGRQNGGNSSARDVPFSLLSPFFEFDADVFSLQKNVPLNYSQDEHKTLRLIDYCEKFEDFSDTAAFIEQLDLVICVDSVIAHLAGALGKPCWLMLGFASEWRWQLERSDSPWYSTIRLFRQTRPGDWYSVVHEVTATLRQSPLTFAT